MRKYSSIMLVDDDSDDLDIFTEAIGAACSEIRCSSHMNPVKALASLKAAGELPDLILLDYNMPLLNGKEFLAQLISEPRLKNIPVIFMSTPPEKFMEPYLDQREAVRYISKPNSFTELLSLMEKILLKPTAEPADTDGLH